MDQADAKREGKNATLFATATNAQRAIEAAAELAKERIEIEVINFWSLFSLDSNSLVISIRRTSRLLIFHEPRRTGGISAEIVTIASKEAFEYFDAPIERFCVPEISIPVSPPLGKNISPKRRHRERSPKNGCLK